MCPSWKTRASWSRYQCKGQVVRNAPFPADTPQLPGLNKAPTPCAQAHKSSAYTTLRSCSFEISSNVSFATPSADSD